MKESLHRLWHRNRLRRVDNSANSCSFVNFNHTDETGAFHRGTTDISSDAAQQKLRRVRRFASISTVHASVHASVHTTVYVSTDCAILAVLQQAAQSALSSSGVQMHLISNRIRITTRLASDAAYLPLKELN
jgi:hypothetical protein